MACDLWAFFPDRLLVIAMAALSLLVNDPRIDVAVALIGAGDYEQNMKVRYENLVTGAN